MNVLFIVGPTATGKTALALEFASLLIAQGKRVYLLSADSKQAYSEQDIVTGKDKESLQSAVEKSDGKFSLFGIDVVKPHEEWSVAHFLTYVRMVVESARADDAFLIVVGGTGMYVDAVVNPPQTASIVRDEKLRALLETKSVDELRQELKVIDPLKFDSMNESDSRNPRRLIRAIEVATHMGKGTPLRLSLAGQAGDVVQRVFLQSDCLSWVGLDLPDDELKKRIAQRVEERIQQGAIEETKTLLNDRGWTREARSAIGYEELIGYLFHKYSLETAKEMWATNELAYVKRQRTWFKRHSAINWYSPTTETPIQKIAASILDQFPLTSSEGN
ncbi:hypothetical protein C5B42_03865 [Candidatus Cerribacteria bacterium 'Amazon FNV 2010 28 9']|uniref:tRNA dimethylallyltransferase n=1 Tax=Candidatus Cerribacteria bacterium 'Amazon FNV 2010 28 9' TaxID=2081795 RepID=A0A317JPS0_9BACT|nr:MAG: hypothetical protein C5B42_03865 [Candidatus Cerribacteria bacterium 'Amazon FNV 2010 28 9']